MSPVTSPPAGLVVLGMLCFYWGEAQVQDLHAYWDSLLSQTLLYMPSVLHIVYTNMLATVYRKVAAALTEYGERAGGDAAQLTRLCNFLVLGVSH